ncbi:hypothetical protein M758_UG275700 [Ceratodon purpureus]|nr:hypothetical protein M758_UG275700 [Ceratodon purpureus]
MLQTHGRDFAAASLSGRPCLHPSARLSGQFLTGPGCVITRPLLGSASEFSKQATELEQYRTSLPQWVVP